MTRSSDDVRRAADLLGAGLSHLEVSRQTGIPRSTVREWAAAGIGDVLARRIWAHQCDGGPIELAPWQERIALEGHPQLLLRGLIHSDGYRGMNRIKGRYAYPRYLFSNRSADIRGLFTEACRRVGVHARQSGRWQVSVARREHVELLDTFIGPKR